MPSYLAHASERFPGKDQAHARAFHLSEVLRGRWLSDMQLWLDWVYPMGNPQI